MEDSVVCLENVPLSDLTTIGIGGLGRKVCYPKTVEALKKELDDTTYVLGNGSNVLASDHGYSGKVIVTKQLKEISWDGTYLSVDAGVSVGQLSRFARTHKLTGWEFLYGIPATIGGLIAMNGGANGSFMSDIVHCVTSTSGEILSQNCEFGYKTSRFLKRKEAILSAKLRLSVSDEDQIDREIAIVRERRSKLPKEKSMGCVFKNPHSHSAGVLISCLRLNGTRVGDAMISHTHGNFILNVGYATEKDVLTLIELVKNTVLREYSIELEEEIQYLR